MTSRWTPKQIDYARNATHRWNIKCGATRSGKTYFDYYMIPRRIADRLDRPGLVVLLGNTKGTLQRNIIEPMQQIYGADYISSIRADNTATIFGHKCFCLGADNKKHVDRIRGASISYCYGDEVTTWDEDVFDMLKSRLDKPYSIFDGTCNPTTPQSWVKRFIDSDADIYSQHYTIDDNPFLPPEFVANLKREYAGTVYYDRYIRGLWVAAEGLVYPMFAAERHVVPDEPRQYTRYVISMDYGILNPTAMQLWGECGGVWYCVREYYHSGRDTNEQKTDDEYYAELERLAGNVPVECVIVDPSAASFITLVRRRGKYKVRGADNAVTTGIQNTALCLQEDRLKFCRCCKNTIGEFAEYLWDTKKENDTPIKEHDHAMDAMRYMVMTMRVYARSAKKISLWG